MSKLLPPHGSSELKPLLLEGQANREETRKAQGLKKIPLTATQLGAAEMAELKISVDKSYVPAQLPGSNSTDPRELGVRVFHAFVDPR